MAPNSLGHTLVIANPAAHSGRGAQHAEFVDNFLRSFSSASSGYQMHLTSRAGEATRVARDCQGYDTIIALGGDGIVHEVVCGLMDRPRAERPRLGVVPVGSGNDYARTLGIALNDSQAAMAQLVQGSSRQVEVGMCNGVPFMETLSFGLDAAIALDTTDRRAHDTSQEGSGLYVTSGIKILSKAKRGFPCTVSFDGERPRHLESIIFAVQVGPTYGGGFAVCPSARPDDGLLDVCFNVRLPPLPHLMLLFALARTGRHVGSSVIETRQIRRAAIDFDQEPPCQVDGERLAGAHFEVEVVPDALDVIFPA